MDPERSLFLRLLQCWTLRLRAMVIRCVCGVRFCLYYFAEHLSSVRGPTYCPDDPAPRQYTNNISPQFM